MVVKSVYTFLTRATMFAFGLNAVRVYMCVRVYMRVCTCVCVEVRVRIELGQCEMNCLFN